MQGHIKSPEKFKPWGLWRNLYAVLPIYPNFLFLWLILISDKPQDITLKETASSKDTCGLIFSMHSFE